MLRRIAPWYGLGCGLLALSCMAAMAGAAAVKTVVVQQNGQWELLRDGQPYDIKGAGGSASMQLLKQMGGNSVRTWGTDAGFSKQLDEAQQLGLSVCVGLGLTQARAKGFNYKDPADLANQAERVRETVLKYKDHPAVLMWGVGNEVEGYGTGDDKAVWAGIEQAAAVVKKLDPDHPTMAVIAEIGGDRVKDIQTLCPDIDVIGVNSYAGCASLPQRYQAAGGTKPYVITEFGPIGTWEAGKTSYGALLEPTSTEKAAMYQSSYTGAIATQPGVCLGGYAFLWGWKQEGTATWFGMMLQDGTRLDAVAAMSAMWTGHPVTTPGPSIEPITVHGASVVLPLGTVHASVKADDQTNRPVKIDWQLHPDAMVHGVGGDFEASTDAIPGAIASASEGDVELHMPAKPGVYRLYAFARDDQDNAATANVPLLVRLVAATPDDTSDPQNDAPPDANAKPATPPPSDSDAVAILYGPNGNKSGYIPSGWMGNTGAVALDEKCTTNPHDGKYCIKAEFKAADNFGGVVWQNPANNWGDIAGGKDLSKAKKVTFWARGENGGETVQFKFGLIGSDKKFSDSGSGDTTVTLTKDWTQYSIDAAGKDLSRIVTGFCWVAAGQGAPITFYLDDIQYQ